MQYRFPLVTLVDPESNRIRLLCLGQKGGGEFEAFGLTPDVFYVLYMYNIFIWGFF